MGGPGLTESKPCGELRAVRRDVRTAAVHRRTSVPAIPAVRRVRACYRRLSALCRSRRGGILRLELRAARRVVRTAAVHRRTSIPAIPAVRRIRARHRLCARRRHRRLDLRAVRRRDVRTAAVHRRTSVPAVPAMRRVRAHQRRERLRHRRRRGHRRGLANRRHGGACHCAIENRLRTDLRHARDLYAVALIMGARKRGMARDVKTQRYVGYSAKPNPSGGCRAELGAVGRHQRPLEESADHWIPSLASGKAPLAFVSEPV